MEYHNLLEEFGHMWCIGSLSVRNKVRHFGESINYHEYGIHSLVCARKFMLKSSQLSFGTGKGVYRPMF